jgi:hypothetical protein
MLTQLEGSVQQTAWWSVHGRVDAKIEIDTPLFEKDAETLVSEAFHE